MAESEIDPDLANWVIEFHLHQDLEFPIMNSLVQQIPIPQQNLTVSKLFLVQKLQFEATSCGISENLLDYFDRIYELDKSLGSGECGVNMRKAFCDVAVECSVKCMRNREEYFELVKRLWRGRVRLMEEGGVGLVSEELLEWRDDLEAAVWEESVWRRVVEKGNGVDAKEAVKVYVKEEKSRVGPSFLELVSETLEKSRKRGREGDDDQCGPSDGGDVGVSDRGRAREKGKSVVVDRDLQGKGRRAAYRHPRPIMLGPCRGVKIVDLEESGGSPSCSDYTAGTREVAPVQEAPNKVVDPAGDENVEVPRADDIGKSVEETAEKTQSVEANLGVENMADEPSGDQDRAGSSGIDNAVNVESGEANARNAPKSLMERNKTAHTMEWNDSIDNEPSSSTHRPDLPTPKRRVLPLTMYTDPNPRPSRYKRWSAVEEDALRAGVAKYGMGCWKTIINEYPDIFVLRSCVDLKDKWRNMSR